MRGLICFAIAVMLGTSGCTPPAPQQTTTARSQPVIAPLAAQQPAILGGGPCPIDLPGTASADQLEDAFKRVQSCRRSRALRIDKLHVGGQLSRARAAAQIIELRAEARRDIQTMRGRIARLAPTDRRRLTALLDKADAETQKLDLRAS